MFNLKPEVFLPVSAVTGCIGAVVQLPHVPTSSLCGVDHLHQPIMLMMQALKVNWGSHVSGTGLPKGFACSSAPALMLTPARGSLH